MHMSNSDIFGKLGHIMFSRVNCCLNLENCKKPGGVQVEAKFYLFYVYALYSALL